MAKKQKERPTWKTADKVDIYIDMMEDRHLVNTLRMLRRHYNSMAKASVDGSQRWEDYCSGKWPDLLAEAKKRNIDYETWGQPAPIQDEDRAERSIAS